MNLMKTLFSQSCSRLKTFLLAKTGRFWGLGGRLPQRSAWIVFLVQRYWMILAGLLAALIAFFATQQYAREQVSAERERLLPKGGFVEVLVAARNLSSGEKLSAETIAVRQVPREWMLSNALRPHEFDSINQTALSRALDAGNPLTLEHLRQSKSGQSSVRLEPGYRAISIAVDEVSAVGGLIQPGDRVDLWGTALSTSGADVSQILQIQPETVKTARLAKLVAENLRVIATGQKTERSESTSAEPLHGSYSNITLAVPSAVAAAVLGGQFQGRLGIALRSPADSIHRGQRKKLTIKTVEPPIEILIGGVDGGLQ